MAEGLKPGDVVMLNGGNGSSGSVPVFAMTVQAGPLSKKMRFPHVTGDVNEDVEFVTVCWHGTDGNYYAVDLPTVTLTKVC